MNKKGILMIVLIVLAIAVVIFLAKSILNKTEDDKQVNTVENQFVVNDITNSAIENVMNNYIEENIVNTENTTKNESIKYENVQKSSEVTDSSDDKNKAIQLVKKDWGKDDSVYFYVDEEKGNGKYVVSVRNKETTSVVVWYNVDINSNKVEMQ